MSGLDEQYDSVVDTITALTKPPSLSVVYSLLLSRNARVEIRNNAGS
jgi:hypothetical protein